ncbi:acyl-CoA dehydrogenase family protein [Photobacterium sp. WH77]|uniref:Acyl-CoA dehydrogenase family protein n=1 Tax=Photobacterium arenosum TaxID=2774143 RepID=A0ABR9BME7_9GAMM|nr:MULTISPECIES: acyl-CoA dehydrogenase family protein [Photobacterium]MBD8513723.1 acyl-CoA dehydrogenase family protein [Photobacterium arenosum]MCG2839053.1 acyl-CoA dehydrogenase family protein [Photobacterium sp. WH77]MCG2846670.1 acyl-CoA dehydrogenase family protein [Photobacterium sp. WH80]MDO6582517.1 acyl-CoA dehydrogenase family protein [Photobacterium sp. 2_MG-2023]
MTILTESQTVLVERARLFAHEQLLPFESKITKFATLTDDDAKRLTQKGIEAGFFATNIATGLGGRGLSLFENVLVQEQLGVTKDILVRRATGNVYDCLTLASACQREQYLQPSVAGKRWAALAVSEPDAGSDVAAMKTQAVRTDSGWLLKGSKLYISDADYADYFIVAAKTAPERGVKGISLFLVDKQAAGFSLGQRFNMIGFDGTSHRELIFDQIELANDALLGEENQGFQLLCSTLGKARLAKVAARGLGKCVRLLHEMTEHAKQRQQFGQSLSMFGTVQSKLADGATGIRLSRALLWETAKRMDAGEACREEISMLKVYVSELLGRLADDAVQLFGASGCHDGGTIESFYRDARLFRIIDGTSEIHRNIISGSLLKNGVLPLCDV